MSCSGSLQLAWLVMSKKYVVTKFELELELELEFEFELELET